MKLGSQDISAIRLGDTNVSKAYLGENLIWTSTPATISYTAQVNPGIGSAGNHLSNITGWTPDNAFALPADGNSGLQIESANDPSPITMVVTANNSAKGASVLLIKNSVTEQSLSINNVP